MCSHKVSVNVKFEGSTGKIDFRNAKNVSVTWPAIMRIFNEVWYPSWNPMKTVQVIVRTPSPHDGAPRFIMKCVKKSGKIQILKISKTRTNIMCPHKVSLHITFNALAEKLISGMPKMPKSHDQPLCANLIRYDAHIVSHPRSSPKWCI